MARANILATFYVTSRLDEQFSHVTTFICHIKANTSDFMKHNDTSHIKSDQFSLFARADEALFRASFTRAYTHKRHTVVG